MTAEANSPLPDSTWRIFSIGLLFFVFFVVIIFRSYHLQILGNEPLNHLTKIQHKTRLITSPRRGTIFDRHGDVLAQDILVASIGIHPLQVKNKNAVLEALLKYTSLTKKEINVLLESKQKFVWAKRRIDLESGQALEKLQLKGLQISSEYRRFYPHGSLAGQLLGAVGYDAQALGGVESSFDEYLKQEKQKTSTEKDAHGRVFVPLESSEKRFDVYLTIDKTIQNFAEEALKEQAIMHKAKQGFVIVQDVNTAELLAVANWPEFNPNSYWLYKNENWNNQAVMNVFEPGSTFKTFLLGAAYQSGKVKPQDKFFCENGNYRVGRHVIHDSHPHGWLTAQEILQVSSNVGVTKIAQKIGKKSYAEFLSQLGFGKKTDSGLWGENAGKIRAYSTWRDIEFSNISFGQGLSVNGLQMVSAYTAIADKGVYKNTKIIQKMIDAKGRQIPFHLANESTAVMSENEAQNLREALHAVTQSGGTAGSAHVAGYLAGGKTGTAQKFNPHTGRYATHEFVSSFIGFVPLESPEVVIYVVLDSPMQKGYYGGVVAAPGFKKIAKKIMGYTAKVPQVAVLK